MEVFDNVSQLWGGELRSALKRTSKVRIAASALSIFAFDALRKELEDVDEVQFLFTCGYTPGWAIVVPDGTVKHVYFVAETKSTHAGDQWRVLENSKITAARRFFQTLSTTTGPEVTYDVVTDYDDLIARAVG